MGPRPGVFNVSGPYAVGKDSIINVLLEKYGDLVYRVRTITTRPVSKVEDPSYDHVEPAEFERIVSHGSWIHNRQLSGATAYATNLDEIRRHIREGQVCLHSVYPGSDGAGALRRSIGALLYSIALLPPGGSQAEMLHVLERRIVERNRDTPEALRLRISHQVDAISFISENPLQSLDGGGEMRAFDKVIINEDLSSTISSAMKLFGERFGGFHAVG